jgi:hypothetical protein
VQAPELEAPPSSPLQHAQSLCRMAGPMHLNADTFNSLINCVPQRSADRHVSKAQPTQVSTQNWAECVGAACLGCLFLLLGNRSCAEEKVCRNLTQEMHQAVASF